MANWTGNKTGESAKSKDVLERYSPQDISDNKNLEKQIRDIEMNQGMNFVDKMNAKRKLFKGVAQAKKLELMHHLDSYENYLMARKDVEAKAITQEATKAILYLEKQYIQMMNSLGMDRDQEHMDSLQRSGEMLTRKLEELELSPIEPKIKSKIQQSFIQIWEKAAKRMDSSLDNYMEELTRKEGRVG